MRMWMIDPSLLCRKHLLGEHSEIHKHRHVFVKHQSVDGRLFPIVTIEPLKMKERHDELVLEMMRRGYNHESPFEQPDLSFYGNKVDVQTDHEYNLIDLMCRCEECSQNIENKGL